MAAAICREGTISATFFLSDVSKNYIISLEYSKGDPSYNKLSWLANVIFDLQNEKLLICDSYSGTAEHPMPLKCVKILKQIDFSILLGREKFDLWDLFPRFVYPLIKDDEPA